MQFGGNLTPEMHQYLDVRTDLVVTAYAWERVKDRVERDFGEAFAVSDDASSLSARYLDGMFADTVGDGEPPDREALDEQGRLADQLDEFAKIAAAIVILVVDEQLRRIYRAVNVKYHELPAGPLVGPRERPMVAFSDLVRSAANSFRHMHQWEDLKFNYATREYEQGSADDKDFRLAMQSLPILRQALDSVDQPFVGAPTLEVLRVLGMNRETFLPDWLVFKNRFVETVRDIVCRAKYKAHYDFVREYVPGADYPPTSF